MRVRGRPVTGWTALVPFVGLAAGLLIATSATTANGTQLRSARSEQLSESVATSQQEIARLEAQEAGLRAQLTRLASVAGAGDARVSAARERAAALQAVAGLSRVRGDGLTVALNDAPPQPPGQTLPGNPSPDMLVVHQQDVQAVVNALWAGGATAMSIMGQRVISTSAVRCVGNTLLLHGRVYSPPFVMTALGDPRRLQQALDASPDVQIYRQYVAAYDLGYSVRVRHGITLPAYDGPLELSYAEAAP